MKAKVAFLFVLAGLSAVNGFAQAPKVNMPNRILDKCMQLYLDSTKISKDTNGIFMIEFLTLERVKVNYRFTLEDKMLGTIQLHYTDSEFSFRKVPTYIYSGVAVAAIYFGIESYTAYNEENLRKFRAQIKRRFAKNSVAAFPIIKYRVDVDSISAIR